MKKKDDFVEILAKLNSMLIVKHGDLFNVKGKAPSWDWVIAELDRTLSYYKYYKKKHDAMWKIMSPSARRIGS